MATKAVRYHDICAGHRVYGHESKCRHLHGHNYRIHFYCEAANKNLDSLGRVIDFSQIKVRLCEWLEEVWDHKFLLWENDPLCQLMSLSEETRASIVPVPFNPTAENMAEYLVTWVCPEQLKDTGIVVTKVVIEETRKCSVEHSIARPDDRLY